MAIKDVLENMEKKDCLDEEISTGVYVVRIGLYIPL